jgi:hypothetical protein
MDYSQDAPERIAQAVSGGMSRGAAARLFGVSNRTSIRCAARATKEDGPNLRPRSRPAGTGLLPKNLNFLITVAEAKPDMTLEELAALLLTIHDVRALALVQGRLYQVSKLFADDRRANRAEAPPSQFWCAVEPPGLLDHATTLVDARPSPGVPRTGLDESQSQAEMRARSCSLVRAAASSTSMDQSVRLNGYGSIQWYPGGTQRHKRQNSKPLKSLI